MMVKILLAIVCELQVHVYISNCLLSIEQNEILKVQWTDHMEQLKTLSDQGIAVTSQGTTL